MSSNFWIQTHSGTRVDLLDPQPEMFLIEDIAFALSYINRFTGHLGNYTVAQHSVLVSHQVPEPYALCALLHDAAEAYVGDVNRPLKMAMREVFAWGSDADRTPYDHISNLVEEAIARKFDLQYPHPACIKEADLRMVMTERDLFPITTPHDWELGVHPYSLIITPKSSSAAYHYFWDRWLELQK